MKVSEKSLELNIGAELLGILRHRWNLPKAYLRGLTQAEERQEGVDFFVHLDPATRIYAFQFKAPKGRNEQAPYRYTLVRYQHDQLHTLAAPSPGCVFYVFPFYVTPRKLQVHVPDLLSDTWLLDVAAMAPSAVFGTKKTTTIACSPAKAKINPEYRLEQLHSDGIRPASDEAAVADTDPSSQVERPIVLPGAGVAPSTFANWYSEFRSADEESDAGTNRVSRRRNSWLARGMRVVIVPP